jgi:hypothetical protein
MEIQDVILQLNSLSTDFKNKAEWIDIAVTQLKGILEVTTNRLEGEYQKKKDEVVQQVAQQVSDLTSRAETAEAIIIEKERDIETLKAQIAKPVEELSEKIK